MQPLDPATWARLSALYEVGCELPARLRAGWLKSVAEDEPALIEWLRAMLADTEAQQPGDAIERGPALPPWPAAQIGAIAAPAETAAEAVPGEPKAKAKAKRKKKSPPQTESVPEPNAATLAATPAAAAAPLPAEAEPPAPAPPECEPPAEREPELASASPSTSDTASAPEPAVGAKGEPPPSPIEVAAPGPESGPESRLEPRRSAPALATGLRLGPWVIVGPMSPTDARVAQWRVRRADETTPSGERALLVPHEWRPRPDLAAWLTHSAARPIALVHPRIARFVEVGVADDGTPWMATELAEGQPIDRWFRDHPLDLRERRAIFEQVVEAASFAHAGLVLHGQVHPAQILITPDRRVRWLYFCLGEMLDLLDSPPAAESSVAPGSPSPRAYAAPEQAGRAGHGDGPPAASASGDIHALGLILLEVLAGASPWHARPPGAAGPDAPRWPRPSDLVGTARLRNALRGDFDAITAKATHTDPLRRYASLADLQHDLQRAGARRPVAARDGGFFYQVGCLARRHPRKAAIAVVLGVVSAVSVAGLAWSAWSWSAEREQVQAAQRSSESLARLLQDLLYDSASPGAEHDWPSTLARAETMARATLKEQPASLAAALAMLGRWHAERGAFAEGRNLLAEALPLLAGRAAQLEAGCDEAWAQARQGEKLEEAEQRLRRVTESSAAPPLTRVLCTARLADLDRRAGRRLDAYQSTFQAWQLWESSAEKPAQLALLLSRPMGAQSAALGRFHESQLWFEWALKQATLLQQDKAQTGLDLREQWVEMSLAAGNAQRALELADANLAALTGSDFPDDADPATAAPAAMFYAAAEPRLELQRLAEARARIERAITLADARGDDPMRQRARCLMAQGALRERDTAAAARWLKLVPPEVAAANAAQGRDFAAPGSAAAAAIAGAALRDLEREATRAAARAAEQFCRLVGAELSLQQGLSNEAFREADRLLNSAAELTPRLSAQAALLRAEALLAARQYDRALSAALLALQQSRAMHESNIDQVKAPPSWRSGQAALVLTEAHRATGDIENATQTLDYALQQLGATLPESHPWRQRAEATRAALAVHGQKKP